ALAITRDGHAQRGGERSRSVAGAKRVVLRFIAPQETADAAILLDGGKLIAPPGQDLVRIGLMPDIPHQTIARRIKRIVKRYRQLDRAQRSARVPADPGHRL